MKDKRAVTSQRICIIGSTKKDVRGLNNAIPGVHFFSVCHREEVLKYGALSGNFFRVVLRKSFPDNVDLTKALRDYFSQPSKEFIPNYFGRQRFGWHRPTGHVLGWYLLKRNPLEGMRQLISLVSLEEPEQIRAERAQLINILNSREKKELDNESLTFLRKERSIVKSIFKNENTPWKTVYLFPRNTIRFYLHSVSSYIFNLYVMKRKELDCPLNTPIPGEKVQNGTPVAPIVGYHTPDHLDLQTDCGRIIQEIMTELNLEFTDFNLQDQKHIWMTVKGSWRPLTVQWKALKIFPPRGSSTKQKLLNRVRTMPKTNESPIIEVALVPSTYFSTFLRGFAKLIVPSPFNTFQPLGSISEDLVLHTT